MLEASHPVAQLKILDPKSGTAATTFPTDTSRTTAFAGRLRKNGCIADYDCVVSWSERLSDTIRLWVPWTRDTEINLALAPYDLPASRRSVDGLDRYVPKNSRNEAMQTYVGGRRVFQKLWESQANRYSNLAIGALRVWLNGALAASELEPSFGRDESLVQAVERFRTRAARDHGLAGRWQREFESSVEMVERFELYRTLEFVLYDDIQRLIDQDRIQAAILVVEELLKRLDGTQGEAAVKYRSVDRNRLLAYQEQLRARPN